MGLLWRWWQRPVSWRENRSTIICFWRSKTWNGTGAAEKSQWQIRRGGRRNRCCVINRQPEAVANIPFSRKRLRWWQGWYLGQDIWTGPHVLCAGYFQSGTRVDQAQESSLHKLSHSEEAVVGGSQPVIWDTVSQCTGTHWPNPHPSRLFSRCWNGVFPHEVC